MTIDPRGRSVDRTAAPTSGDVASEIRRTYGRRILLGTILVAAVVVGIAFGFHYLQREHPLLIRLLDGDASINVKQITIHAGGRTVVCTNRTVLAYLAEQMRHSQRNDPDLDGRNCTLVVAFSPDDTAEIQMYATGECWALVVGRGLEAGWPSHEVVLAEPQPEQVRAMMKFVLDDDLPSGAVLRISDD